MDEEEHEEDIAPPSNVSSEEETKFVVVVLLLWLGGFPVISSRTGMICNNKGSSAPISRINCCWNSRNKSFGVASSLSSQHL